MSASVPQSAASPGTAVIVGMSGPSGLAVVRALAPHGVACHAVHGDGRTPAMSTRLARTAVCPDWRREPDAFVDSLCRLAARLPAAGAANGRTAGAGGESRAAPLRASLFVCDDAALDAVWAHAERLRGAGLRAAFSAGRPLADLLDKRTQMAAAERAGVAIPWTRWGSAAELAGVADECPYPVIVKPASSHLGVKALGAKALRCVSAGELKAALERAADIEVLVQEYVPGGDDELYTAGLFVCEGGHLAFTGRKLKQNPPGLGIARLAETVDEPALVPAGVALLRELGYEGISQVEYKRDPRDGSYRLMEVNFRPWIWIGLATATGVNLPLAAHSWACADGVWLEAARTPLGVGMPGAGRTTPGRAGSRPSRWVWAIPEAAYTLRDLRRGRFPRLEQWRGLRAEALFSRRDPAPFVRGVADLVTGRLGADAGRRDGGADRQGGVDQMEGGRGVRDDRGGRRPASRLGRGLLTVPATALTAAVLWSDWRRAGRRSVTGAPPVVGLPGPGPALVLAPHPDDETIMCGATLAALSRRGDAVRVVAVTTGSATAVGVPSPPACRDAAADAGGLRVAELRAACRELGVDDVAVWDFADGAVTAARDALADRVAAELAAYTPASVFVPFPFDAHADHVGTAMAVADALARRPGQPERAASPGGRSPSILCGPVQTPLSVDWATRLVAAGTTWAVRRAAANAHASRGGLVFSSSSVLARLHPAHPARPVECFVELSSPAFVRMCRSVEAQGLTKPDVRSGGHALTLAFRLVRTRGQRDRIGALLRAALAGDDQATSDGRDS